MRCKPVARKVNNHQDDRPPLLSDQNGEDSLSLDEDDEEESCTSQKGGGGVRFQDFSRDNLTSEENSQSGGSSQDSLDEEEELRLAQTQEGLLRNGFGLLDRLERGSSVGQVSPTLSLRSSDENSRSAPGHRSGSNNGSNNGKKYPCGQCGRALTDIASLQRHLRAQHTSPRIHACGECGKTFATSSGLKQHAHIHSSVKPFQCEVCLKSYTQFSNLCRHKRMHADCRAQSRCEKCTAPFASSAALAKHKRFCDVASSVNNNNNNNNHSKVRLPPSSSQFQFTLNPTTTPSAPTPSNGHHKSESTREIPGPFGTPEPVTEHPSMEALRLEILNNQNKVMGQGHRRTRSLIVGGNPSRSQGFTPPSSTTNSEDQSSSSPSMKEERSPVAVEEKQPLRHHPSTHFPLVFPAGLPLYNPFAAALCPQFFGTGSPLGLNNSKAFGIGGTTTNGNSRPASLSPISPPQLKRVAVGMKTQEKQSGVIDYTKVKSPVPVPPKSDTPLDLSMQKCERKLVSESCEESISSTVRNNPTPTNIPISEKTTNQNHRPASEHRRRSTTPKLEGRGRGLVEPNNNNLRKDEEGREVRSSPMSDHHHHRPTPTAVPEKRRKTPSPQPHHPVPPHHFNMDSRKPSAFSQIIAPRPLHPFPRFSHPPPTHFPGIFPQNPFNPFFPPNISPRNDLSNNFNPNNNGPWPGKMGNRYSCRYCGKIFPRSANLTRHLRTHTGEQPYKCRFCERSFSISSNLQRHVRNIHHKEKPFKCGLCGRSFGQQTNLDRHVRKHETGDLLDIEHEDSSSPSPSPPPLPLTF